MAGPKALTKRATRMVGIQLTDTECRKVMRIAGIDRISTAVKILITKCIADAK